MTTRRSGRAWAAGIFLLVVSMAPRTEAAVTALNPPPSTPQIDSAPSTTMSTNFTIGAGSTRLLVVSVNPGFSGSHSATTVTVTYGGQTLTQIQTSDNAQRRFTWLGYLKQSELPPGATNLLEVTLGGDTDNLSGTNVYIFSYDGVDQNAPITDSGNRYINNQNIDVGLTSGLSVEAGGYGIFAVHTDDTADPADEGGDSYPFPDGNQSASGNYSRVAHRAFVAADTTNVALDYPTVRAGIVGATLRPHPDNTPTPQVTATRTPTPTRTRTRTPTATRTRTRTPTPAATRFLVTLSPASAQVDAPVNLTVQALNSLNQPVASYSGTVLFDSSDFGAIRPGATLVTGGQASLGPVVRFSNAGTQTITAFDRARPELSGFSNAVNVTAPASGHFYVSLSGDDGPSVPGTFAAPWRTIQSSVNRVAAGSTLHVRKGTYTERLVIRKALTLIGESIGGTVVSGGGSGTVIKIGAHTGPVVVRRLTVTGSGSTPLSVGIDVYGVGPVTLTNNIVKGNRNGICVNEASTGSVVSNNTFSANANHHLVVRNSDVQVRSNIFLSPGACIAYGHRAQATLSAFDFSLSWGLGLGLCPPPNPPPPVTNVVADPLFFDAFRFYVGSSSPAFDTGPTDTALRDVDGSRNDRGAHGGPFGELHLPYNIVSAISAAALAAAALLAAMSRRRKKQNHSERIR